MKLISNMKIGTRLIASFIFVSIIAGGIGFIGILNIQKIDHLDTELYQKITVPLSEMVFVTDSFQRMRGNVKDVVLSGNASEIADYEQRIQETNLEFNKYLGSFKKTLLTDAGKQVIAELEASKAKYDDIANRIIQLSKEGRTAEALTVLRQEEDTVRKETEDAISVVTGMKIDIAEETATSNTSTAKASTVMMTVLLAAGVIISILLGLGISYSINKPVKKLMAAADRIAKGDLSVDIDASARDEIGSLAQSFKQMTDSISEVMFNINISAAEVAAGSRQLADSSVGLSHGATEQASSIEELNASINDIANQTNQNAANANQANDLALSAKSDADEGNLHMTEMLRSMEQINESSENICKIIKVIDEIAFQTNILALNAAVEAARAGQHGKGFAVVAEEVRNLAARSANAAKETTQMIEGSMKTVEVGRKTADETAKALDKIVCGISKASELVGEIAQASKLQAAGISQINIGVEQVSQVIQSNSATAEQSAAASEELTSQANLLKEMVQKFKLRKAAAQNKKGTEAEREVQLVHLENSSAVNHRDSQKYFDKASGEQKISLSDREFGKYNYNAG